MCAHLNIDDGDGGLGFVEMPSHPVHRLGDVVQHQIQIHFIFLEKREQKKKDCTSKRWKMNYQTNQSHEICCCEETKKYLF